MPLKCVSMQFFGRKICLNFDKTDKLGGLTVYKLTFSATTVTIVFILGSAIFSWFIPYLYALASGMISRNCHQRNQALVQGLRIGLGHFGRVSLDWTGTSFFVYCQHTKLPSLFRFPIFIYTFRFSSRHKMGSRDTCSKYGLDFLF